MNERGQGAARREFVAAAVVLAALFLGNNLPSALYGAFREAFGYTLLVQTLLYAAAVAVILPSVVVFGSLSDFLGRRLPIAVGLLVFAVGDLLFIVAQSAGVLFAARLAQGLGMGFATAVASAALADSASGFSSDTHRAQRIAAITTTVCITGGLAAGPLLGGVLAQYAPIPLRLSFYVHLAMLAAALALTQWIPGRQAGRSGRFQFGRLAIPSQIRPEYPIVAASGFVAWSVLGVFSAVIASFFGEVLGTHNLAVEASALTLVLVTSSLAQLVSPRIPPLIARRAGLGILALGLVLLVIGSSAHAAAPAVAAMLACGVGHGFVFAGELGTVVGAAEPEERGAAVATVFLINYAGLGIPVIGVGLAAVSVGLFAATRAAAVVFAVVCLLLIAVPAPWNGASG